MLLAVAVPWRTAVAHADGQAGAFVWTQWPLSGDVTLTVLAVLGIYLTGAVRRRKRTPQVAPWRHAVFFTGLAALFLALQSPVDSIAERVYWMHQIQHLLLRMLGPFLIVFAMPQTAMTAGQPIVVRQRILAPFVGNVMVRGVFGFFAHPVTATIMFIGTLLLWQWPDYHNLALRDEPLHYLMHISMLLSGLFFWWRVIDLRPRPLAAPYAARMLMLWIALAANIALGAYLFFKRSVLYTAYDNAGRLWGLDALDDERIGALILWLPGSMMMVVGVLIVLRLWVQYDSRIQVPGTPAHAGSAPLALGPAHRLQLAEKNRRLALALLAFVFLIITVLITLGLIVSG